MNNRYKSILKIISLFYDSLGWSVKNLLYEAFYNRPKKTILIVWDCLNNNWNELNICNLLDLLNNSYSKSIRNMEIWLKKNNEKKEFKNFFEFDSKFLSKLRKIKICINLSYLELNYENINYLISLFNGLNISLKINFIICPVCDSIMEFDKLIKGLNLANKFLSEIKDNRILYSFNYVVNPETYHMADDFLSWCYENKIKNYDFTFQLLKDIKKNSDNEVFGILIFFDKLAHFTTHNLEKKIFYSGLVNKIFKRKINDIYYSNIKNCIIIDSRSNLIWCPHNNVDKIELNFKFDNAKYDNYIRAKKLLEDYENHISSNNVKIKDIIQFLKDIYKKKRDRRILSAMVQRKERSDITKPNIIWCKEWKKILVTGWYGTETTGDKAILGEVIYFIKKHFPKSEIQITTLDEKISYQTNLELEECKDIKIIDINKSIKPSFLKDFDALIMGGGPLMETDAMKYILNIFAEGSRKNKSCIIFGCGIGPLHSLEMKEITSRILGYTTAGFFRDKESFEYAKNIFPEHNFYYGCDPALGYLKRWTEKNKKQSKENNQLIISTFFRANTREFFPDLEKRKLEDENFLFASKISSVLKTICKNNNAKVSMLPMNCHWIGGDDRTINRMVFSLLENNDFVELKRKYIPINEILQDLSNSDIAVAMRYHSHLFCLALGIPFISIDYSGEKGKVYNLLKRINYTEFSQKWESFDEENCQYMIQRLINEKEHWSVFLKEKYKEMLEQYNNTFQKIFHN